MDQFSRNVYRGQAKAFALDPIARQITNSIVDADTHKDLRLIEV